MIDFVFTVDYEIYGDGRGAFKDLVYEPARRLVDLFLSRDVRFVAFVEAAEFEKIERYDTDSAIALVSKQIEGFCREGFEIGLHLHPQWCNAHYERGRWLLDSAEYNLCTLPRPRIVEIVRNAIGYLRHVVNRPQFTPRCFRAGNWLFQPTSIAASVLGEAGIHLDSSVFKGGLQRNHGLDYRPAQKNGYFWRFEHDVNDPDPRGRWIEVPIYTERVLPWRMATSKRLRLNHGGRAGGQSTRQRVNGALDLLRYRYPLKLDFCRMTLAELVSMTSRIIQEDRRQPEVYKPIVAIGHTKDLRDMQTVSDFLTFLHVQKIPVTTFDSIYSKLAQEMAPTAVVA
ncbi:MAG: hypothetical protein WA628_16190 [Terriglobales bacterium]